jgi:hypothetical protein
VDWELIVSTICICVRQVNWCMIDNWNKIDGLRLIVSTIICVRQVNWCMIHNWNEIGGLRINS